MRQMPNDSGIYAQHLYTAFIHGIYKQHLKQHLYTGAQKVIFHISRDSVEYGILQSMREMEEDGRGRMVPSLMHRRRAKITFHISRGRVE